MQVSDVMSHLSHIVYRFSHMILKHFLLDRIMGFTGFKNSISI
jgi:hypothetical protein